MKRLAFALAVLVAACSGAPQAQAPADPTVARIETGDLKGVQTGEVIAFKGVPYAAPPVGDLRWRPPQPAAKWQGVRDASQHGAICMQKMPNPDNGIGQYPASEDCLTLGVWTTKLDHNAKQPVMLWIHGGGFVNGSGSADLYDGSQLAKRGVVLVSINYRLGRFGSFAHPLLTKEAAGGPVANYGMMDMVASLEWTKRNIAAFGGDPDNITIFGESAGGMAVQKLMTMPSARGLFHKAIVQSGAGRENVQFLDKPNARGLPSAESSGEAFITSLGVTAASAKDLRAIPAADIMAKGDPSTFSGGGPIIDGTLIPMTVVEAFKAGKEAPVPYMVGYNSAEFPSKPEDVDASLTRTLGARTADLPRSSQPTPTRKTWRRGSSATSSSPSLRATWRASTPPTSSRPSSIASMSSRLPCAIVSREQRTRRSASTSSTRCTPRPMPPTRTTRCRPSTPSPTGPISQRQETRAASAIRSGRATPQTPTR